MVVHAVFSERVSGKNSLLTGNLTGKNRKFGLFRIVLEDSTPIYSAKKESYRPFPCYLNNREIKTLDQGKKPEEQASQVTEKGSLFLTKFTMMPRIYSSA